MLELATHDNPHFHVKLFEIMRGGTSYMVDTLRYLKRRAPRNQYYLIMGSDEVNDFENWREPETIALLSTLVGVRRPNYLQNSKFPMILVDAPNLDISSMLLFSLATISSEVNGEYVLTKLSVILLLM